MPEASGGPRPRYRAPTRRGPRQKAVLCVCRLRREHTCRGASLWLRGAPAAFVVSSRDSRRAPVYCSRGAGGRASESHVALGGGARLALCVSVVPAEVQTPEGAPVRALSWARLRPNERLSLLLIADCVRVSLLNLRISEFVEYIGPIVTHAPREQYIVNSYPSGVQGVSPGGVWGGAPRRNYGRSHTRFEMDLRMFAHSGGVNEQCE